MSSELHSLEVHPRTGKELHARLDGEIDRSNASEVLAQLLEAARGRRLMLDLTHLEHLDSSGMAMLHALSKHTSLALIVAPGSIIARAIAITELDRLIPTLQALDPT